MYMLQEGERDMLVEIGGVGIWPLLHEILAHEKY
jgi:hypothetical protein